MLNLSLPVHDATKFKSTLLRHLEEKLIPQGPAPGEHLISVLNAEVGVTWTTQRAGGKTIFGFIQARNANAVPRSRSVQIYPWTALGGSPCSMTIGLPMPILTSGHTVRPSSPTGSSAFIWSPTMVRSQPCMEKPNRRFDPTCSSGLSPACTGGSTATLRATSAVRRPWAQ
jgi:hypothetical protein